MPQISDATAETANVAPEANNPNFKSPNCGSPIGSATGGPMGASMTASINGSTNLSQCIKGPRGAYINSISIERYEGAVYRYKIRVNGRGPSGFGQRAHLTFTTQQGEECTLSLASTTVKDHTVKCKTGGLVLIAWNFS
jgi:hypothetical protein